MVVFVGFLMLPWLAEHYIVDRSEGRVAKWALRDRRRRSARPARAVQLRLAAARRVGYLWFDIAVLWVCFKALGHTPPIADLVLAYQIGYLSNLIPIPGGIGVLDGSFVGMFVLYGDQRHGRDLGDDRLPRDLAVGPGDLGHGRVPAAAPHPQRAGQLAARSASGAAPT